MPDHAMQRSRRRWVWVAALLATAWVLMSLSRGGEGLATRPGSAHVHPVVLLSDDVGAVIPGGGGAVRVNPPIDVVEAERWASRLPLLDVPLPDERQVETWRLSGGIEVTQAVLYYGDAAEGARLESMAGTLLSTGLGLQKRPLVLAGADSALGWEGPGFVATSFRRGPFVVLVGVSGPAPAGAAQALAERALLKVQETLRVTEEAQSTRAPPLQPPAPSPELRTVPAP